MFTVIIRLVMAAVIGICTVNTALAENCDDAMESVNAIIAKRPEANTEEQLQKAIQQCPDNPLFYHLIGDYYNQWWKKEITPEKQAYYNYLATEYYAKGVKLGKGKEKQTMMAKLAFLESNTEDISEVGIRSIKPFARVNVRIFFEFNSWELGDGAQEQLDELGKFLAERKSARIVLEGHTDMVGSEDYNQMLSIKRAESAKEYLVSKFDILPENIETQGYGFERLADVNDPFSPRNRRVRARKLSD